MAQKINANEIKLNEIHAYVRFCQYELSITDIHGHGTDAVFQARRQTELVCIVQHPFRLLYLTAPSIATVVPNTTDQGSRRNLDNFHSTVGGFPLPKQPGDRGAWEVDEARRPGEHFSDESEVTLRVGLKSISLSAHPPSPGPFV